MEGSGREPSSPAAMSGSDRLGAGSIACASAAGSGWEAGHSRRYRSVSQTSLTGRIAVPPARIDDARDGRWRPATVRVVRKSALRDARDSSRVHVQCRRRPVGSCAACPSGRRGPFEGQHGRVGLCACTARNAETPLSGRAVRQDGCMSATPPLSCVGADRKRLRRRGVRSTPLRGALRENFGLGAPDASLITRRIRVGST